MVTVNDIKNGLVQVVTVASRMHDLVEGAKSLCDLVVNAPELVEDVKHGVQCVADTITAWREQAGECEWDPQLTQRLLSADEVQDADDYAGYH
ncbi:hypothetical protein ATCC90586_008909 [Pythium insidiosum]|nr:hypothetical protein ATCC90586_008909 [Pythium insidiosum]